MILQFRCPPDLKAKVDELVKKGLYPDFSTFCLVALENQLLLEDGAALPSQRREEFKDERAGDRKRAAGIASSRRGVAAPRPARVNGIPQEVMLSQVPDVAPLALREHVASVFSPAAAVPVNRWLLGHYNRLFPAKVSCRALVNLSKNGKASIVLDEIAPLISEVAAQVGGYLRALDAELKSHRDDSLSIAFPEPGDGGAKGRLRYQNHFVGHMVKGQQEGLLVGLKLAVLEVKRNRPVILPTHAGWAFARLPNPILDGDSNQPQPLGEQEIEFLLGHIQQSVPVELFAYKLLLSLIGRGHDTPESTNQGLMEYVDAAKLSGDVEVYIATQRGGVLGRMKDLQLIHRERIGTSFRYHVSDRGAAFLARVGEVQ